jgi:glyoxylase-like metal-dependent hydrolase (beta-lactamase superfamily II)
MKKIIVLLALFSLLATNSLAHISLIEGHQRQQEFKVEKVAGSVYVLFGQGGNIGISYGEDGLMMIDTQFQNVADKIKAELQKLGTDKSRFVFNTHWHGDHTGGNPVFGQDATIIAHSNVRTRLLNAVGRDGKPNPAPKIALPMITYDSGLSLHFNGEEIKAVHFPKGHTDGDTVIFFTKSNVVHLGDDFFVGRFPFVDLNSGGSVEGLVKNIGELIKIIPSDAKLIPGHGAVATIDDLKNYHQMLIDTVTIVRDQMKAGKTLDEIKKQGMPEKYKEAGSGFIKTDAWIETIFKS